MSLKQIEFPEHKQLVPYVLNKAIGETLTHENIADVMIVNKKSSRYKSQLIAANKALLKHNRQLVSIKGIGYNIIGADGMVDLALKYLEKSKNRSKDAMEIITSVDKKQLSDEAVLKYDLIVFKVTSLYAGLAGGLVEVRTIARPDHVLKIRGKEY